jgi:hypothetical protein
MNDYLVVFVDAIQEDEQMIEHEEKEDRHLDHFARENEVEISVVVMS